ncbi:aromatic acid exporter family protein [Streptomyces sp. NPDC007971]|uniref:FUSC family protein n=1 Tax=Streptomyces sp. NPDC007971 TaxID=3364799 RepID=UPI0036E10B4F
MLSARMTAPPIPFGRTECADAARATVAAGLTWQACVTLLHAPHPYVGAVAALLIVEATVVRTLAAATRYAAGCVLGVAVAVPAALYVEPGTAGLALVVFASVVLSRREFLGHHGLHLPTTALITYALVRGRHPAELADHLAEIVLGLAFGLACSALLLPAVRVRSAERALERLRTLLAHHLDGLADSVTGRGRPREVLGPAWRHELDTAVAQARTAVEEAHESVRWNVRPTARRHRRHLDRRVLHALADVEEQVCATGRLLDERPAVGRVGARSQGAPRADGFAQPYARLLRTTALCVYDCRGQVRPHPALPAARHAVARLGRPGCDAPVARAEDRHLLRHLDAALTCLTTSAPAPPRPSARRHRAFGSLRPTQRR